MIQWFLNLFKPKIALPIIKFNEKGDITNIDELLSGVKWEQVERRYPTMLRKVRVWLCQENAVKLQYREKSYKIAWGEVWVEQTINRIGIYVSIQPTDKSTFEIIRPYSSYENIPCVTPDGYNRRCFEEVAEQTNRPVGDIPGEYHF